MNCRCVRFGAVWMVVALLLFTGGCAGKGTVTGKVRHKAKPVVWGTVSMIASDDLQYTGQITLEGTYTIPDVPNGAVKILVSSPNPDPARPNISGGGVGDLGGGEVPNTSGVPKPPPGAWFPIPPEYSELDKTTLKGTVRSDTTIDLNLP